MLIVAVRIVIYDMPVSMECSTEHNVEQKTENIKQKQQHKFVVLLLWGPGPTKFFIDLCLT